MFEQELEMEKRESSIVPLLLIVGLILSIVAVSGYYLLESRKVLSNQEATSIVVDSLKAQGPATVHFVTGMVKSSVNEKPHDPHYRLLEKAGLINLGKDTGAYGTITPVMLTQQGQALLAELGVTKVKEKDGTESYTVPIAERRLVGVSKVTMQGPSRAFVDFTWKWEPNKLGNLFDASGSMVKSFNTWDRATLIQKHGANFYHGEPTKVTLALMKTDKGWQIATEE
ncbi:MAG: hypothetical protein LAO03_03530 [Acidobacteriia bacterium]|nr:hypothetical protein [Terriglobia bacterium]